MDTRSLLSQIETLEKAIAAIKSIVGASGGNCIGEAVGNYAGKVADNYVGEVADIGPKSTPEAAIDRASRGLCVFCGEKLPARYDTLIGRWTTNRSHPYIKVDKSGRPKLARRQSDRGADNKHYKQVQRLVKAGHMSWDDAVAWGWILAEQPNKGRPPMEGGAAHRAQQIKLEASEQDIQQMEAEIEKMSRKSTKRKSKS
jgi:hypothetical protein